MQIIIIIIIIKYANLIIQNSVYLLIENKILFLKAKLIFKKIIIFNK